MDDPTIDARRREVWARLQTVTDPELDETVTDLNFVTQAEVDPEGGVHIGFRLPTYWCAANFSFLMADDMRRAVETLPWVRRVEVVLGGHMYADTINAGLARGLSFQETFGAEADGNLDDLRQAFLVKAFQRRQVAFLNHLLASGLEAETLTLMTLGQVAALPLDQAGEALRLRYLERRSVVGPMRDGVLAFIDAEGAALSADRLAAYVQNLRRVGINAEFNSALCRGLLSARFDMETPFVPRHAQACAGAPPPLSSSN